MGDFSRDPNARLTDAVRKHYVGVRLQQGVPILDADWNESDGLRRWEIWSFLKWFIGNGVPESNDGFKISAIAGGNVDTIVLISNKPHAAWSAITVNRDSPAAADVLGFGSRNASVSIDGSAAARLTGDAAGPFVLSDGMELVVQADDLIQEAITFNTADFADITAATAAEVRDAINSQAANFTATVGQGNDVLIHGGDGTGTPEAAGRCLVEGWEVLNENDLKYTSQPLYLNDDLAAKLGVDRIEALKTPAARRTDVVYLDVWEREVTASEDQDYLIIPELGVETTVRLKRDWAVRVKEDSASLPPPATGHEHFHLATLIREGAAVGDSDIRDARPRSGLLNTIGLNQTELNNRVKIIRNAIENLALRSRIDSLPSASLELPNIRADAYSEPAGFQRQVDRFATTAEFGDAYYFAPTDGVSQVQTQILMDSAQPINSILVSDKSRVFGPLDVTATVDVSLDGGTNFELTEQALDQKINTQALAPNGSRYQLVLRFNIPSVSESPANFWTARAALSAVRSHHAAAAGANGRLYALGGNSAASAPVTSTNTVSEYDPQSDSWTARASMSRARHLFGAAATRNYRLYAVGGSDDTDLVAEVEQYDLRTDVWTTGSANLPTPRQQVAVAATSNERIFAFGGLTSSAVNLTHEYDPFVDTWTTRASMPAIRQSSVAATDSSDEILVFGGITPSPTPVVSNLEKYRPADDSWVSLTSMSLPRSAHAGSIVSNDYTYAIGGFETTTQTPTNSNQEYDPNADTWTLRNSLPQEKKFAAAASIDGLLYVIGGWDSASNSLDTNHQYTPFLTTKIRQFGFGVEFTLSE